MRPLFPQGPRPPRVAVPQRVPKPVVSAREEIPALPAHEGGHAPDRRLHPSRTGIGTERRTTVNLSFGAKSGWGKSYHAQAYIEENIKSGEYDGVIVLDYKDEFRGLVKSGNAKHWIVGRVEAEHFGVDEWRQLIASNGGNVVFARHRDQLGQSEWQAVCSEIIAAVRNWRFSMLVAIDEAHFVAPQMGNVPDPIIGLATTGRGEGVSAMWITQRFAKLEETVITQCEEHILGGLSSNDLGKIQGVIEYPVELHNPQAREIAGLPDDLTTSDGDPLPLRKFTDDDGHVTGSEWAFSNDEGEMGRLDTSNISMESTHYGVQGKNIERPEYS